MFNPFGGGGGGDSAKPPPNTNLFGPTPVTSSGGFGNQASFPSSASPFGGGASQSGAGQKPFGSGGAGFGGPGSAVFGSTPTGPSSNPVFGAGATQPGTFGATATQSGTFGATATQPGTFGATATQPGTFGATATQPGTFGATATQSGMFGATATQSGTFGATATQPGTFGTTAIQSGTFGATTTQPGTFGATAAQSGAFGATATQSGTFGTTATQPGTFGATATQPGTFGSTATQPGTFGATATQPGTFGATATQPGTFGATATQPGTFGATATQPGTFGATATQPGTFGATATQPGTFGATATQPGTFVAATTASNQPLFGATKPPPVYGSPSSTPLGASVTSSAPVHRGNPTGASSNAPIFGAHTTGTSKPAGSSSNAALFGGNPTRSSNPSFGPTTTAAGLFGGSVSKPAVGGTATTTSSTTPQLFTGAATVVSTASSAVPLFGGTSKQPAIKSSGPATAVPTTKSAVFGATKPNPFGAGSQPSTPQFSSNPATANIFGGAGGGGGSTQVKSTAEFSHSSTTLFAKQETKSASASTVFSSPPSDSSSSKPLFGKPTESQALFHHKPKVEKRDEETGQVPAGLFGKQAAQSEVADPRKREIKRAINIRRPRDGSKEEAKGKPTGLFGKGPKPTGSVSRPSEQSLHRRSSVDRSMVTLKCSRVPPEYNNRNWLEAHFNKFAKVTKMYTMPAKQAATIHFFTHEDALNAKKNGRALPNGQSLLINWYNPKTPGALRTSSTFRARRSSPPRDAVDDELASMAGTADTEDVRALRRPDERRSRSPSPRPQDQGRDASPHPRREDRDSPAPVTPGTAGRQRSLRELGQVVTHSAADRYEVLNDRDKLVRQSLGSSIGAGGVLLGTCEDMCPEKERYVREGRRRLSVYEIVPETDGTRQNPVADHARTVKEYSRSSADQDVPLPHELRPSPTLLRTMDYLVVEVMDPGAPEGQWADWYEFLWSRTRGIRKDITQQQLCDLSAVHLVEVCARWHIYCAHRLCAEDMMTFDAKINNENLTKCLQTLKELYHDLAKKEVTCPREAEFRAYLVLMNLNEGDILRETQELRQDLRESEAVQFVIQVFYALNSNNYVRFFKLVKRASFLNACIMHRYFNQVRTRAVWTMMKAYYMKAKFPLADLVRCLAFEDEEEAQNFCEHHNLAVQDGCVVIDKAAFIEPETRLPDRRAPKLIEAKQTSCLGQVVNGGTMPVVNLHTPHCSFDETGRLKDTSLPAKPTEARTQAKPPSEAPGHVQAPADSTVHVQPLVRPEIPARHEQQEQQIVVTNEFVKDLAKELFREVIREQCVELTTPLVRAAKWYLDQSGRIAGELLASSLNPMLREVAESSLSEAKEAAEAQKQKEEAERAVSMEQASQAVSKQLLDIVLIEQSREMAEQQYDEVQATLRQESRQRVTASLCDELLEDVIEEQIAAVGDQVHFHDVIEKDQRLEDTYQVVQTQRLRRYFKQWRSNHMARMRMKFSLYEFPPGPGLNPPGEQLQGLLPQARGVSQDNNMELANTTLTSDTPQAVIEERTRLHYRIAANSLLTQLQRDRAWQPLDIPQLILPPATRRSQSRKDKRYWKLVVSLPDGQDDPDDPEVKVVCEWVRTKFRKGTTPNPEVAGKTEVLSLYRSESSPVGSVSVCVRSVNGSLSPEDCVLLREKRCLHALSGLCFVVSPLSPEQNLWRQERDRLSSLLESCGASCCPVLVLAPSCSPHASSLLPQLLALDLLKDQDRISAYSVVEIPDDIEDPLANTTLCDGIMWLSQHWPDAPAMLPATPMRDFVEAALCEHFSGRVYPDLAARQTRGLLHQSPGVLISLYNELIQYLADSASSDQLEDLCWPMPELSAEHADLPSAGWNSPDHLAFLQQSILELSLPEFSHEDSDSSSWDVACDDVAGYLSALIEADEDKEGMPALYSRVALLLEKTERGFKDACWRSSRLSDCTPTYLNAPWTDIIMACVNHRLDYLQTKNEQGEALMVHVLAATPAFCPPRPWLDATEVTQDTQRMGLPTLQSSVLLSTTKRKLEKDDSRQTRKIQKSHHIELLDLEPVNPEYMEATQVKHDVKEALHKASKESKEYDDYLARVIGEGESMNTNGNFFLEDFDQQMDASFAKTYALPLSPLTRFEASKKRRRKRDASVHSGSLSQDMERLNQTIELQKSANRLFEIQLDLQCLFGDSM